MHYGRLLWTLVVFPGLAQCLNGGWSGWLPWGPCTSTVFGDVRSRERHCDNPAPSVLGMDCQGQQVERSRCSLATTVLPTTDGAWSSWSAWGTCSATCNGGLQSRTRTCTNPAPSTFGRDCRGNDVIQQLCNTKNCPDKKVGFSVYYPNSTLTSDRTPMFIHTIFNTGSYNSTTGKFTCAVAGLYSFSLTIRLDSSSSTRTLRCKYQINGADKSNVYSNHDGTMMANLDVGDVVNLFSYSYWNHVLRNDTKFSGVLITPA